MHVKNIPPEWMFVGETIPESSPVTLGGAKQLWAGQSSSPVGAKSSASSSGAPRRSGILGILAVAGPVSHSGFAK